MLLRAITIFCLLLLVPLASYHEEIEDRKMPRDRKIPNRLITEKSPYLLQHAYNPVDWYPWGEEAFDKARREDKPIFLSIGYSTCHWCHVMEKESFEDPRVANLLNETFICIKVDREERPDIDHVYMTVCQIMTGSGGWPLTIMMTPDKHPFFAATYIPKTTRFGRVGMLDLIPRIRRIWKTRRKEVLKTTKKIIETVKTVESSPPGKELSLSTLKQAYDSLANGYDQEYGGFSSAPKFPTPHNLTFSLRYWKRTGEEKALEMVKNTLRRMREGGIYDHIGFGFHRYSVDQKWLVPHFEKMLYDQALISIAYLEAYQVTADTFFADVAKEIFSYVIQEMTSDMGGFYSAQDADSEGEEGKFYVWSEQEIFQVLDKSDAELICKVFGVKKQGNFKEETSGQLSGKNILHLSKPLSDMATSLGLDSGEFRGRLERARLKLYEERKKRIPPQKDDKILTDWNGLMIAAFAKGGQVLRDPKYVGVAEDAANFILRYLARPDGRIFHRFRDGEASIEANLDDYVFLIWGLIELYEATFTDKYLSEAVKLNDIVLRYFWDKVNGGFFFTPDDGEKLILRKKEVYDGAIPSGNSVALLNLLRLSRLTDQPELEERASELVKVFSGEIQQLPSAYTQFLCSFDFAMGPSYELVIAGKLSGKDVQSMLKAVQTRFFPNLVILLHQHEDRRPRIKKVAEFINSHDIQNGSATAYLCQGFSCKMPTKDPQELLNMLSEDQN